MPPQSKPMNVKPTLVLGVGTAGVDYIFVYKPAFASPYLIIWDIKQSQSELTYRSCSRGKRKNDKSRCFSLKFEQFIAAQNCGITTPPSLFILLRWACPNHRAVDQSATESFELTQFRRLVARKALSAQSCLGLYYLWFGR